MRLRKFFFFLLTFLLTLSGCQQSEDEIKLPLPAQAFTANSTVAELIRQTTLKDGSPDNMLDSASCVSIVFPVTVFVNGQEISLNSEDDLKYVERIIDELDSDVDELEIVFPLTVLLTDYSQVIVQNEDALDDLMDQCTEEGLDTDIECVDFIYPIMLATYNINNEVSKVITIESDEALYNFIDTMDEGELVSFTFPIVMQVFDGSEITIKDNEELKTALQNASDDCDEDDDVDFDEDDIDTSDLITTLLSGSWKVDYFFNEVVQTAQFESYVFTFNADGSATANNGVTSVTGGWAVYGDDGKLEIVLDFGEGLPFDELSEDWEMDAFTSLIIALKDDLTDEDAKTLTFKRQ